MGCAAQAGSSKSGELRLTAFFIGAAAGFRPLAFLRQAKKSANMC